MRLAIVHENWGAGAARCARDLETFLGQNHTVQFFPRNAQETTRSFLEGLNEFKADVVNCHSFYGGMPYGILADISRDFPTCFTVHDPRPIGTVETICWTCDHNGVCLRCPLVRGKWQKVLKNPYFRERLKKRRCHQRCAPDLQVVAPSQWMADRLRQQELQRFGITTIPNGIDLEKFRAVPANRAQFHLPEGVPVILHSAWHGGHWALNHRKGLSYLAEAFVNWVVPQFPRAVLAVAGESFAPNHPNVRPLGMIDQKNLASLLSVVDVFVLPTLADNFPYTVLEAMACEKAVVASRVGGVPEQVDENKTGLLVPPADVPALGAALVKLLSNPEQMREFGKAGRQKVEARYGMERFCGSYETLFEKLASQRRGAAR